MSKQEKKFETAGVRVGEGFEGAELAEVSEPDAAAEIAAAYRPGTAQTVDETHPAVIAAAEDAKIGDPVDLAAEIAAMKASEAAEPVVEYQPGDLAAPPSLTGTGPDPEPNSAAIAEAAGTTEDAPAALAQVIGEARDELAAPDDAIRASREYGDLLERGYMEHEALAELKARTEAAQ